MGLLCGLLFCLATPVGLSESGTSARFFVSFTSIVYGTNPPRLFFRG
jgi:hypothetical protein